MMKRLYIINLLILLLLLPATAQKNPQGLKREVTLYNPYKPSLNDVAKKSFLPNFTDTARIRPDFRYSIETSAYSPEYPVSPIKAASLVPEPLDKLYKSYVNLGMGNYITPLAEISITNERSKKSAVGIYARHFSSNGKVKLENDRKVYAGYMDNDLTLFGRKFLKGSFLEGSVDFVQKSRSAYGYDTSAVGYNPSKSDVRFAYQDAGAKIKFASLTLDSSSFAYDFNLNYDFFFMSGSKYEHHIGFSGSAATIWKEFYAGADIDYQYYLPSASISTESRYIASVAPFIKKSAQQWSFKVGVRFVLDKNLTSSPEFHFYPDASFSFAIVPSYVSFFASMGGNLAGNNPAKVADINPYLVSDTLFKLKNTSNTLVISAGLKGNTGMDGNYLISASYSFVKDRLLYTSTFDTLQTPKMYGNLFVPLFDDGEVLKIHGEIGGNVSKKITYSLKGNIYNYTLSNYAHAWNLPVWDAEASFRYNLRNKIIGTAGFTAIGKRFLAATSAADFLPDKVTEAPVHMNLNIGAEYRYTKVLSFWTRLNNITFNRYYEWAWYPTQRFQFMLGATYSM